MTTVITVPPSLDDATFEQIATQLAPLPQDARIPFCNGLAIGFMLSGHIGSVIGFLPIRDMVFSYQMLQSTSPPTPAFTAAFPVITPRDVVRMLVPSPASTSGTSSRPK